MNNLKEIGRLECSVSIPAKPQVSPSPEGAVSSAGSGPSISVSDFVYHLDKNAFPYGYKPVPKAVFFFSPPLLLFLFSYR